MFLTIKKANSGPDLLFESQNRGRVKNKERIYFSNQNSKEP
jgi:hypothetical protein